MKNLSDILLKVGGMFIIVMSITKIPSYVLAYSQYAERSISLFLTIVVIPNIIPLLLGILIFTKPGRITNKIVYDNDGKNTNLTTSHGIEQAGLTVLGFYLLFLTFSDIVFHLANFIKAKSNLIDQGVPFSNTHILTASFVATIAELIFSLWLILKSKGILRFIGKIRSSEN